LEDLSLLAGPTLMTMVSAHAISKVNGNYLGHPVDVRMFEATNWELTDPIGDQEKYALQTVTDSTKTQRIQILRRFEFEPSLQRMSAIIMPAAGKVMLCTKGSPEALKALADPSSIPPNFEEILREYAKEGVYVIGCAYKQLPVEASSVNELKRDALETDLNFCGLLIFENQLKEDSVDTIFALQKANVDVRMITGDNIHTAIAVGRKCDIIHPRKPVYIGDTNEHGLYWTELNDPRTEIDISPFLLPQKNQRSRISCYRKSIESYLYQQETRRTSKNQDLCKNFS